jgi:hypothetical protein
VLEPFPSNGLGTDLQKTSYVIAILPAYWRTDCYIATSNDIRNSIVACVYSVARCLPVCCLAIHVTVLILLEDVCLFWTLWLKKTPSFITPPACDHTYRNALSVLVTHKATRNVDEGASCLRADVSESSRIYPFA